MEQSIAMQRLLEVADLVKMTEDLLSPGTLERLNSSSLSGVRITLKNVREIVLASHDTLAANLVNRAKAATESEMRPNPAPNAVPSTVFSRSDLRASLEKVIER